MSAFQSDSVVERLIKGERKNPNGIKSKQENQQENRRLKVKTIKRVNISNKLRSMELEILCLFDAKME